MTTVATLLGDFDKPRYDDLVKRYKSASSQNKEYFILKDGAHVQTSLAKYLIEFLDPHFKDMK